MFGAEAGANDAGDDDADLRGLLVEFAAGRKLCGALEPDGVTDDGCAVRLLACGHLSALAVRQAKNLELTESRIEKELWICEAVIPSSSVLQTG